MFVDGSCIVIQFKRRDIQNGIDSLSHPRTQKKLTVCFGSLFLTVSVISAHNFNSTQHEKKIAKKSYVCPPKFIRQGHRCYFFSKNSASWQEAYFACRDMRSNLAIIRNPYQDKLIKNFLNSKGLGK